MKDQDMDPRESGAHNPYRTLLHKLTGTTIQKPRQKPPVNIWRKTQRKEIDFEAKKITESENVPRSKHAAIRDKVARDMFERLPEEEKGQWIEQAKEEYDNAMLRWKEDTEGNPSTEPEDRQRWAPTPFFVFVLLLTIVQMHPGTSSLYATDPGPYLRSDWLEVLTGRRWARTGA